MDKRILMRKKPPICLDAGAAAYRVEELEQNGLCWREYAGYLERKFDTLSADVQKREELRKK